MELLLLMAILAGVPAAVALILRQLYAGLTLTVLAGWLTLYGGLLAHRAAPGRVLAMGEEKRFCGVYLDCHLAAAVTEVQRVETLGQRRAEGTYLLVTVRFSSDARRAKLRFHNVQAEVVDSEGRRYRRMTQLEDGLPLEEVVGPGEAYVRKLVFEIPRGALDPQLVITEGSAPARFLELFLMGDEDSLWSRPSSIRLSG